MSAGKVPGKGTLHSYKALLPLRWYGGVGGGVRGKGGHPGASREPAQEATLEPKVGGLGTAQFWPSCSERK